MADTYADIHQSFNRCLRDKDFLNRFYRIFLDSDPRIGRKFENTDWKMQVHLLRHGISASILYAAGGDLGEHELARLHKSHGRKGYKVDSWMYDNWLESLIAAIRETDPQIDDQLEARWRAAMSKAIERIR